LADNYPMIVENLLRPRERRREFFRRILRENVTPGPGYLRLIELLELRVVLTVLTTNFDELISDAVRARFPDIGYSSFIDVIQTNDDLVEFSTCPTRPQLIYLHGSVDHYTDKNLVEETQSLDDALVKLLVPLLRDHPLVVIGYRGTEPSVMRHLLRDQAMSARGFPRGVFWCHRGKDERRLHPMVLDLAATAGANFQLVKVTGFDEVMDRASRQSRNKVDNLDPEILVHLIRLLTNAGFVERCRVVLDMAMSRPANFRDPHLDEAARVLYRLSLVRIVPGTPESARRYTITDKGRMAAQRLSEPCVGESSQNRRAE
jgi:hypothetical protein